MNFAALRYEELALNAFPVLHTEVYDGWILRFSGGTAHEGNCVSPLYLSTKAYEDKIEYCENKFREKGLPCVFKMTANVPAALDQQLAMREYEQQDKTYIMECRLTNEGESLKNAQGDAAGASAASGTQIRLTRTMDDSWLEAFLSLDGGDCICPESARAMLTAIRNPVYCAALYENDRIIGCGLGVVEDGKIGLYDIRVHNDFRQKGIGARICRAIMEEGRREGADTAFLQASAANRPAVRLYQSIGFEEVYTYWYRIR